MQDYKPNARDWLSSYWKGFNSPDQIARIRNTGVPMDFLKEVCDPLNTSLLASACAILQPIFTSHDEM